MICSRCARILRYTFKKLPIRVVEEAYELTLQEGIDGYREKILSRLEPQSHKCWICAELACIINAKPQAKSMRSILGSHTVEFMCVALLMAPPSGIIDAHVTMEIVDDGTGEAVEPIEIELQLIPTSGKRRETHPSC